MSAQRKLSFGKRGHANRTKDGHNHSSLPPTARQAGRKRGSLQRLPQRPAVMAAQRLCRHAAIALPPLCCQSAVTLSPFVGIGQEPDKNRTRAGQEADKNRTETGQEPDKKRTGSGQEADKSRLYTCFGRDIRRRKGSLRAGRALPFIRRRCGRGGCHLLPLSYSYPKRQCRHPFLSPYSR